MSNSKYNGILSKLSNGTPLEPETSNELWRQLAPNTKRNINKTITESVRNGPTGIKKFYWISAPYGGGKTQAIGQITNNLNNLSGKYKFLTSHIDLKEYRSKFDNLNLDVYILQNVFKVNEPIEEIDEYIKKASSSNLKKDDLHNNLSSIGIDLFSLLTGIPVPGLGTIVTVFFNRWRKKRRTSIKYLRKKLQKFNIEDEESIEFLSLWLRHSLLPSEESFADLKDFISKLSYRNRLLDKFFSIIKEFNYSGIMLIIDEADKLRNATLTSYLETLWDNTTSSDFDLIIAFAGNIKPIEFDQSKYEGFYRRMADETSPAIYVEELYQPSNQFLAEDIEKSLNFLKNLSLAATGINFDIPDNIEEAVLNRINTNKSSNLTWNRFWNEIFNTLKENAVQIPNTI